MRSGALPAPTTTNAIIGTTVAIICCCILIRTGDNRNNGSRKQQHGGSVAGSDICEGLVDLIRDQDGNFTGEKQGEGGEPGMTREELARGRLVVVVFGPSSTAGYQVGLSDQFSEVQRRLSLLGYCCLYLYSGYFAIIVEYGLLGGGTVTTLR